MSIEIPIIYFGWGVLLFFNVLFGYALVHGLKKEDADEVGIGVVGLSIVWVFALCFMNNYYGWIKLV